MLRFRRIAKPRLSSLIWKKPSAQKNYAYLFNSIGNISGCAIWSIGSGLYVTSRLHRSTRFCALFLLAVLLIIAGPASWALHFDRALVVQHAERKYGRIGVARLEQWLTVLDRGAGIVDPRARLATVNDFWNRHIQEGEDRDIWKQEDYWATPLETLARGRGDCEDFVIGKYFSLVHLGVEPEKLRLIYVRAQVGGKSVAHMVLGYYERPDSEPLILDNLRHSIRPASERRDLTPVFSFNAEGVYAAGGVQGAVDRISRWQGLLSRMQQEGFQP